MLSKLSPICPQGLLQQAKQLPAAATAVINAGAMLAMESAYAASQEQIITPTLIGDIEIINKCAEELGWDISSINLIAAASEQEAAELGVALARSGEVSMLMKGHVHSDTLLRAVLNKDKGLRTGARLSHVFYMSFPDSDRVICITDAVINIVPDLVTQGHILNNTLPLMHALGYQKPNIALLSATEVPTTAMPSSMQAKEFLDSLDDAIHQQACLFGPVALDGAISPEAAKIKGITTSGVGHADVLMVPNIETGNGLFKQMVYLNGATAAGLVLGAKVPIMLTSRADPTVARLASAALGSVYSHWLTGQCELPI